LLFSRRPPSRRFLKEFDIEFFAPDRKWHGIREGEEGASRSPVLDEEGEGGKVEVHYLEVRCGIHPLAWSFRAGDCEPAALGRGLPASAELRRRIITFYADFNTRLGPLPFFPSRVDSIPSVLRVVVPRRAAPLWDFELSIPRYCSLRPFARSLAQRGFSFYVALPFFVLGSPAWFTLACRSSEISWAIDRVFLDTNGGIRRDNPRELARFQPRRRSFTPHLRTRFPRHRL